MSAPSTLILGIGNILWADEGFGVRVVEELHDRFAFPNSVTLMDGGTQGLYLVQHLQAADRLLVFDAIDYGLKPGTMKVVAGDEVPRFMGAKKMSLHQTGFQEVIAAADLLDALPDPMVLIGVQPEELEDYGGSLRPIVKEAMERAIVVALEVLRAWGIEPVPRSTPPLEGLTLQSLTMEAYEARG
ncbi:MAG: HyaD/HybD family hydrogenase maturation endopeptidase [Alphaproteobacteria bacterium CG_4_10_14_0_2_um_filter_63_37]|nr:MAG: hydrogenase expression/formation protein [Proteobacteria bacterium CG1_02_64_396]PJA25393.1 MAG: HyaD/HybD family hydrogenase maturation endopeptidase [Alphaproteobacteria bacterium CG_4_10_14_0_2_um_filter_63_37]